MGNWGIRSRSILLLTAILFSASLATAAPNVCQVMLSSFNVENFVYGDKIADDQLMAQKIQNLAKGIVSLNSGQGPDFMGLAEVSTPELLKRLVNESPLKDKGYQTILTSGEPDYRGTDVGLISKWPLIGKPIAYKYWNDKDPVWQDDNSPDGLRTTRRILEAHLRMPDGEELIVFINHWPSRRGGETAEKRRHDAAQFLHEKLKSILNADPDANIAVVGDFNTDAWAGEIQEDLGVRYRKTSKATPADPIPMTNLTGTIQNYDAQMWQFYHDHPNATPNEIKDMKRKLNAAEGSYYYRQRKIWNSFDQIMLSPHMMRYYAAASFHPVKEAPFVTDMNRPWRFGRGGNGISDHLPVVMGAILPAAEQQKPRQNDTTPSNQELKPTG